MIVKTREQAVELANNLGYVINYDGFMKGGAKCNCFAWYKFWNWFKKDTTQHYHAAEDAMPIDAMEVITISICKKCGKDYHGKIH